MIKIKVNKEIILWQIHSADAAEIFEVIDKQRDYLNKWLPFVEGTRKLEDTVSFVESIMNLPDEKCEYVFIIRHEGNFAGLIGLKGSDIVNRKTEIGYWLSRYYQGKGIMTVSVRALCLYAYNEIGFNRIQIKCAVGNIQSKKIPQRLGFHFEGIEREGEILSGGIFTDIEVYSMLRSEMKLHLKD
jgi:ribosomal-protein-serine acetyltransferase